MSPMIRPGIVVVLKAGCLRAAVLACAAGAGFSAVIAVAVVMRRELLRMILSGSRRCDDGSEIFHRLGRFGASLCFQICVDGSESGGWFRLPSTGPSAQSADCRRGAMAAAEVQRGRAGAAITRCGGQHVLAGAQRGRAGAVRLQCRRCLGCSRHRYQSWCWCYRDCLACHRHRRRRHHHPLQPWA